MCGQDALSTCSGRGLQTPPLRHRVLAALCVLVAFVLNGNTPPPIEVADSLEWMTWDSDLIVLGSPRSVVPDVIQTNDSMFEEQVTVVVKRVLYGSYNSETLNFQWKTNRGRSMKREVDLAREPNVTYDRPQLFFLRRSNEGWTLRRNVFPNGSSQGLATAAGGLARTADQIMGVIEKEIANRIVNVGPIDIDPGPDKFSRTKTLSQGCFLCIAPRGAVMLKVSPTKYVVAPAYPRFQADAVGLCQSEDFRERERGAFMLRSYPGEAATRVLITLLADDGAYRWNLSTSTACATYMVRAAAYDVLRERGIVVPKPLLDECHDR
jgi:hypothetical protein